MGTSVSDFQAIENFIHPKPAFLTHMNENKKNTGKCQGESKDAQDPIGGLLYQIFYGDGDVGTYHLLKIEILD